MAVAVRSDGMKPWMLQLPLDRDSKTHQHLNYLPRYLPDLPQSIKDTKGHLEIVRSISWILRQVVLDICLYLFNSWFLSLNRHACTI